MTFRPRGSPRWRGGMKRVGDHETGGAFYLHGTKMIADGELAEAFAELAPSILNSRDLLSLG